MAPGDIAFKCNFATLDPATGMVISRRADRKFEDVGPALCADLDGELALLLLLRMQEECQPASCSVC